MLRSVAPHGVALAILLWPLVGIVFVPMVDLPGHLAITRVLDDFLRGQYRDSLQWNLNPLHKPAYALLYAVFTLLPKSTVGPVAVGLIVAMFYAAICHGVASLGRRSASSPLVVGLALLIAMFLYGSAFFWGLIPFLLSVPPALVAYVSYLRASGVVDAGPDPARRTSARAARFVAAALLAHLVHPIASLFLAIMLAGAAGAAVVLELGSGRAAGAAARLRSIAWPLAGWASAVGALHVLTAPAGHELDLARSAPAFAAPFHGVAAARAFLAQIPIELGILPIRGPAPAVVSYPAAVGIFLAASCAAALAAAMMPRSADRRASGGRPPATLGLPPIARLVVVLVLSALLFLFLRHDIVGLGRRLLWFPVRGPCFLVFFFGVLAAALVLRSLESSRASRLVSSVLAACALALAAERSAVLRVQFAAFDGKVRAFFHGDVPDRWFRSQPFSYADHIRAYSCYFDDACPDHRALFFSIYPDDATIYPVSKAPTGILRSPGDFR
ncbi:MAG: hypothetical protein IT294_09140 [Deltaproteobacteria bacterium]|nr:hypothetical protein [Deltaproteobacteria bacterium]